MPTESQQCCSPLFGEFLSDKCLGLYASDNYTAGTGHTIICPDANITKSSANSLNFLPLSPGVQSISSVLGSQMLLSVMWYSGLSLDFAVILCNAVGATLLFVNIWTFAWLSSWIVSWVSANITVIPTLTLVVYLHRGIIMPWLPCACTLPFLRVLLSWIYLSTGCLQFWSPSLLYRNNWFFTSC